MLMLFKASSYLGSSIYYLELCKILITVIIFIKVNIYIEKNNII